MGCGWGARARAQAQESAAALNKQYNERCSELQQLKDGGGDAAAAGGGKEREEELARQVEDLQTQVRFSLAAFWGGAARAPVRARAGGGALAGFACVCARWAMPGATCGGWCCLLRACGASVWAPRRGRSPATGRVRCLAAQRQASQLCVCVCVCVCVRVSVVCVCVRSWRTWTTGWGGRCGTCGRISWCCGHRAS